MKMITKIIIRNRHAMQSIYQIKKKKIGLWSLLLQKMIFYPHNDALTRGQYGVRLDDRICPPDNHQGNIVCV